MVGLVGDRASLSVIGARTEALFGSVAMVRLIGNPTYDSTFLLILPAGTDKWNAIERLAAQKGIRAGQIVAIGDDTNDLEMIARSGLGIAMGNAPDAVRRAADVITEPNTDAGVAHAIDRYLLA